MNTLLRRLGQATTAHPWRTVITWAVVLGTSLVLAGLWGGALRDDDGVPGLASQPGTELLAHRFPQLAGADARVVLHGPAPLDGTVVADVRSRLQRLPHVSEVTPPQLSADSDTALLLVRYDRPLSAFASGEGLPALTAATAPARTAGLTADFGGAVPENAGGPTGNAEIAGILAALVVLVVAFGSVLAAGLPLVVALVGLGVGSSAITLLAAATHISTLAPTVASMVGIGVGIDYALLLVTRHAEGLRSGLTAQEAATKATVTAGSSVVFAGLTVLISLLGLRLAGLPVYASFGYATALTVVAVVLSSITLVPALCVIGGRRLVRKPRRHQPRHVLSLSSRWASGIGRHPWRWGTAALLFMLLLAAPALAMRTWPHDPSTQPAGDTTRRAYDLVAAEYGPGANGPLLVVADLDRVAPSSLGPLTSRLRAEPDVAGVADPVLGPAGDVAVIEVTPTSAPDAEATSGLLVRLRAHVLPDGVTVTGQTAQFADLTDRLNSRMWLVVAVVVGLALILLTVVFRAPVVAVKAAIMNLLSVTASFGVMVAVFQWGWGTALTGLPHAVPVSSWVPVLMFAILFGLSMDYEVFLLSRIREDWLDTGDARGSVVRGLAGTSRVITSAAAIMVAVFIGFALDPDVTVTMMGVGMAVAVLLDATVVRLVLVPATMAALGRANWWSPAWLDHALPRLDPHPPMLSPAPTPALSSAVSM